MNTPTIQQKTCAVLAAAVVMLLCAAPAGAVQIGVADGLQLSQFDLTFPSAGQADSGYGYAAVDFTTLTTNTGISQGFLNIYSSSGWVVQNMPVDAATGFAGLGTMFNLGVSHGTNVSQMDVYADFAPTPVLSFTGTPSTTFSVGDLNYNAEGRGIPLGAVPADPLTPIIDWINGGLTKLIWGVNRTSVEQDTNQCGPGALANSLQWLENEYGIVIPEEHKPGINGEPDDSLVGAIDEEMNRAPHMPVSDANFMSGKLDYIEGSDLGHVLAIKHWGGTYAPGDRASSGGRATSVDQSGSGISLIDWIKREIEDGEDVELALGAVGGGTGHWVNVIGAGSILGRDWIAWTHDADQGHNPDGTTDENGGTSWFDGGFNVSTVENGRIISYLDGYKLDFAVSESPIPEPHTMLLLGIGVLVLGGFNRRKCKF